MSNVLDLSGGDTSGFTAVDAGSYDCTVFEISMTETSGSGKLPQGTQMVKMQFASQDERAENRRFFSYYPLPTAEQSDNWARQIGSFINFLVALGEDEAKLRKSGFNPESLDNLVGRECVVRVGKEPYAGSDDGWSNPVKSVKPAGSPTSAGGGSSDLL